MTTQLDTSQREIVQVEDARIRPMMGINVLEPLPSRRIPYALVDPFTSSMRRSFRSPRSVRG